MAYRTDSIAHQVHGRDPQKLIDPTLRHNIYNTSYWLEECLGVDALSVIDRSNSLLYIGSATGTSRHPLPFACLLLKLLQIQPPIRIIVEYLKQEHSKYLRMLAAFYIRLVCPPVEVYLFLEPLYADYRKVRYMDSSGDVSILHIDEVVEKLFSGTNLHGFTLPALTPRWQLEQQGQLKQRNTYLHVNGQIVRADHLEQFNLADIDIINPFYEKSQALLTTFEQLQQAIDDGGRICTENNAMTVVYRGQPDFDNALQNLDWDLFVELSGSKAKSGAEATMTKEELRRLNPYQKKQTRKWFKAAKNELFLDDDRSTEHVDAGLKPQARLPKHNSSNSTASHGSLSYVPPPPTVVSSGNRTESQSDKSKPTQRSHDRFDPLEQWVEVSTTPASIIQPHSSNNVNQMTQQQQQQQQQQQKLISPDPLSAAPPRPLESIIANINTSNEAPGENEPVQAQLDQFKQISEASDPQNPQNPQNPQMAPNQFAPTVVPVKVTQGAPSLGLDEYSDSD